MPAQWVACAAAVGAVRVASYDGQMCACSIASHPCKERKDGAPSVGMAHTNITMRQPPESSSNRMRRGKLRYAGRSQPSSFIFRLDQC
jgi:hypothetical protein